jgi:hypothetical protein
VLTNYDNTFLPQPRNTIVDQATDTLSWIKGNHSLKFGMDWQNVLGVSRTTPVSSSCISWEQITLILTV